MGNQPSFSEITDFPSDPIYQKPSYWFDSNSFITPSRTSHKFCRGTRLWDFLEDKAQNHIIGSPSVVLSLELIHSDPKKIDELENWAKKLDGILFLPPDKIVQQYYAKIVQAVNENTQYNVYEKPPFLSKADPWVIAYAKAYDGKVVTLESSKPFQKKPKIPDVAKVFDVHCITIWDALDELGFTD
jgi:hypothetical protein